MRTLRHTFCLLGCMASISVLHARAENWVGTWGAAQQLTEPHNLPPAPGLTGNTLRQVMRVSLAGQRVRVRLSNAYGDSALTVKSVRIARSTGAASIDPATGRPLTFRRAASVTLQPGEVLASDPMDFALAPLSDVTVSMEFGSAPKNVTGHPGSRTTSYIGTGAAASAKEMPQAVPTDHWYILAGVEVDAQAPVIVAFGDSITDGRGSTTNGNDRWPDQLSRRLADQGRSIGVMNMGIGGNAVVAGGLGPTALQRFERDGLESKGVRWIILLEGVNDIGGSHDPGVADRLIAAYTQMIEKAHRNHVAVLGSPILPFKASFYDSPEHEAARKKVNAWIRTSGLFDAVVDLDAAVRDPSDPDRLLPLYDSGDHLHLNPKGYQRMAEAIDIKLFQ